MFVNKRWTYTVCTVASAPGVIGAVFDAEIQIIFGTVYDFLTIIEEG